MHADALSRLPLPHIAAKEKKDVDSQLNLVQMEALPLTHVQLKRATWRDPVLSKVLQIVREGWSSNIPPQLEAFRTWAMELTVEVECLGIVSSNSTSTSGASGARALCEPSRHWLVVMCGGLD